MSDPLSRQTALAALHWQVAMGADEAIGNVPQDRFQAATQARIAAENAKADARVPAPAPTGRQPSGPAPSQISPPSHSAAPMPPGDEAAANARELAAACNTLEDMVAALETFDACPLKRTATNLCLADGRIGARVMLIGEAPGRDEDLQGKPFVGRSGQLLDKMLAAIGLARDAASDADAVFISNMLFWRPPGNRKPTEAETLMCQPFVQRLIELARPDMIVCLGGTPTQRLSGQTAGILRLRGRWLEHEAQGRKIPLLATLHPAYLLRQPAQKRLAWRDLLALREKLDAGN